MVGDVSPLDTCRHDAVRRGFTLLKTGALASLQRAQGELGPFLHLARRAPWITPRSTYVLFANGADLWPRFQASIACGPVETRDLEHDRVFDTWIEGEVRAALEACGCRTVSCFAHDVAVDPAQGATLDFIQLAVDAALATRAPCRLAIHPRRGLWFALRAFAVLDLDYGDACGSVNSGPAGSANSEVGGVTARNSPCTGCTAPCIPPFEIAMARMAGGTDTAGIAESWLAVRDACPVGREHRYGEEQLAYHMGIERGALLRRWSTRRQP